MRWRRAVHESPGMDIILTGIARSGTTLSCALLNKLPACVALHEPMYPADLIGLSLPDAFLDAVASFFASQRASLLASGTAVSKARGGSVPDNPFAAKATAGGLRVSTVENQEVRFDKPLRPGFRLVVKHPNVFTATLAVLRNRFACFAIVRNPLAALLSWHSIQAPIHDGHLPFGEAFDAELRSSLAAEPDRLERQVAILRWYFSRYRALLPRQHVIRYEDLVASGGRALAVIDPDAASLAESLHSRNVSTLYDPSLVRRLAERLLAESDIYDGFYEPADIAALRASWAEGSA
jgi:hypothetical protein